jgi:prophage tail gpP-like protein
MPQQRPDEIATLIVRGQKFEDWETVWVQERRADSYSFFKFTAAERDREITTQTPLWSRLQFRPDDPCQILLAGQPVINGFIETRQVAYDANSHGVMLVGKSTPAWPARSSVDTKTGNFDGKTVEQVAREVLAPYAGFVNVKVIGTLNSTPFDKLQNQPGEMIWDFLERIARVRGIVMGSDAFGNFLLIGDHTSPVVTDLIEGVNIKKCQAVFSKEYAYEKFVAVGQTAASDGNSGPAASEQRAEVPGAGKIRSTLITPTEQPVKSIVELYDRARNEEIWNDGTEMKVSIVVQGWLRDGKSLWKAGDNVFVKSPMAMLNMTMCIQNATFSQDGQNGTITTLDLVPPWLLKDGSNWNPNDPAMPQGPAPATPTPSSAPAPASPPGGTTNA